MAIRSRVTYDGVDARVNKLGWMQTLAIGSTLGTAAAVLSQSTFSVDAIDANGGGSNSPLFYMRNNVAGPEDVLFLILQIIATFDASGDLILQVVDGTPAGGTDVPANNLFVGSVRQAFGTFQVGSPITGLTAVNELRNIPLSANTPSTLDFSMLPIVLPPGQALAMTFSRNNPTFSMNVGFVAIDPGVIV